MIEKPTGNHSQKFIIQDGCHCPEDPPWHSTVSKITALPILFFFGIGAFGVAHLGYVYFFVWLVLAGIKIYGIRYLVCARCPYYGKNCSSFFGKLVPFMHKKQENKSMIIGLWIDTLFWGILFLYPLYYFLQYKMYGFTILYCLSFLLMVGTITRLACIICPLTICPVGKMGRIYWRILGLKINDSQLKKTEKIH
ncbi:MAG: hypothetical protein KJ737_17795 [Proteobacteria bacterium]|nr:hypothetical protein [Pseudomonadota bacterium]